MEWNARTLVTLWGQATGNLHEYSYRLWGGLVSDFYLPRWTLWFSRVEDALQNNHTFDVANFTTTVEQLEEVSRRFALLSFLLIPWLAVGLLLINLCYCAVGMVPHSRPLRRIADLVP